MQIREIRVPNLSFADLRPMHPEQKRILKEMAPSDKLKLAMDLYYSARELKAAGLRHQHPQWSEQRVQEKVREIFRHAGN